MEAGGRVDAWGEGGIGGMRVGVVDVDVRVYRDGFGRFVVEELDEEGEVDDAEVRGEVCLRVSRGGWGLRRGWGCKGMSGVRIGVRVGKREEEPVAMHRVTNLERELVGEHAAYEIGDIAYVSATLPFRYTRSRYIPFDQHHHVPRRHRAKHPQREHQDVTATHQTTN